MRLDLYNKDNMDIHTPYMYRQKQRQACAQYGLESIREAVAEWKPSGIYIGGWCIPYGPSFSFALNEQYYAEMQEFPNLYELNSYLIGERYHLGRQRHTFRFKTIPELMFWLSKFNWIIEKGIGCIDLVKIKPYWENTTDVNTFIREMKAAGLIERNAII